MADLFLTAQGDISSTAFPGEFTFQYGNSISIGPAQATGGPRVLLNKQAFSASAPQSPGATGADNVLAVYSLPGLTFDIANRSLRIRAVGEVANNTNSKTIKIIFNPATAVVGSTVGTGGTTIASTGAYTTTGATGFSIEGEVIKIGATGSNTQVGLNMDNQIGATVPALLVPVAITAVESANILIAITGNAGTTATDIGLCLMEVSARC